MTKLRLLAAGRQKGWAKSVGGNRDKQRRHSGSPVECLPCWILSVAQFSPSLRPRDTSVIVHLASHRPLSLKILGILDPCLGCFPKPHLPGHIHYIGMYIYMYSHQRPLVLLNVLTLPFQPPEVLQIYLTWTFGKMVTLIFISQIELAKQLGILPNSLYVTNSKAVKWTTEAVWLLNTSS